MVIDHKGNKFECIKDMCDYWNIKYSVYNGRKQLSWSLQECLEGKDIDYVYDHKGNKFKSIKDMCRYWGIKYNVYIVRKHYGWTLEECLEGKYYVYDHKGNKFKSIKDMCEYWNIDYVRYKERKYRGYSLEECLGIIPYISLDNKRIVHTYLTYNLYLERIISIDNILYCECILDNNPVVLHEDIVRNICREYNTNKILSSKKRAG